MAGTKYCMGCMQPLSWDGRCRFCDFREEEYRQEEHHLPLRSFLKNGEYLIGRVLGSGGFGITYIGLDVTLLYRVAVKEFYPGHLVKRDIHSCSGKEITIQDTQKDAFDHCMASFMREGRILAKCSSLNAVAGVKTLFKENGTAYLVMDYVDGMSVKEYVQVFGAMDPEMVLAMIKPVICDLQHIHEEHIFHRDISADNLILDTDGKLVLIDFGSARQILPESEKTNTILYKPGYSALEQYSASGKQGGWTDVYGLCASVYYMLTGIVPDSAMERITNEQMQSLCDMDSVALPPKTRAALWRGMAVEPKDRYQTMAELYQALYDEQISEILPVGMDAFPHRNVPYSVREKVLSRTRMKRELMEISRKRRREASRRRWVLGLTGAALFVLGIVICMGAFSRIGQGRKMPSHRNGNAGSGFAATSIPETAQTAAPKEPAEGTSGEMQKQQTGESTEKQTGKTVEELTEEPSGEPQKKQSENSTQEPTGKLEKKQSENSTQKPTGKLEKKQSEKPTQKPAEKSKKKQTGKSAKKRTAEPKKKRTVKPTAPALHLQEDDHVAGDLRSLE